MNTPNLLNKIELSFWDHFIPLMSESKAIQDLVRKTYPYVKEPAQISWVPAALVASASLGLGMGYILGVFGILIR